MLSGNEQTLLNVIKCALTGEVCSLAVNEDILALAKENSVLPFLFECIKTDKSKEAMYSKRLIDITVMQNYHLLFETVKLVRLLKSAGIDVIVLKGTAVSSFYPVPEYRKSGDIDLLVGGDKELSKAQSVMLENGYEVSDTQHALHHVVFDSPGGIEIEIHKMLAEPFDNKRINQYMDSLIDDVMQHIEYMEVMGFTLPILDDDYQAYELLLHMLQHFLFSGFGLKLLCDWVVYWNEKISAHGSSIAERYLTLVADSKIAGFSEMVTTVCHSFLGLSNEAFEALVRGEKTVTKEDTADFLREVFDGGDFGHAEKSRMVILRSSRPFDYFRAFHHQMHLNFPKAGKVFLLWPFLWVATLIKFLYNNKKVRSESSIEILKKAGQRSQIMKRLDLWKDRK